MASTAIQARPTPQRGVIERVRDAVKTFMYGNGQSYWLGDSYTSYAGWASYGSTVDYAVEAGDLSQNAIIMTCIQSIMRAFPEAPMKVMRTNRDGGSEIVGDHPMAKLLKKPNEYFSGRLLWQATVYSLNLDGNAYWLKVRGGGGQVVELWYEPHFTIRCRWPSSGKEFISHYEVKRGSEWLEVKKEDVVHFRFGIDPQNIRRGISPLASALREVWTDNEAARYSASMLRNMGIPGVVIAPKDQGVIADPEQVKNLFMQKFGGDRRGEPLVLTDSVSVDILSFSPEQMNLVGLRRIPEERIPALLSWPAVVAGLGAGLDRSTYNNMDEARQQAYEQNIIPTQMVLSDDLGTQLLPDFGDPDTETVVFDLSQVRVLQDDQAKLYQRLSQGYDSGWIKRSEARTATGWPVEPDDETYKVAPTAPMLPLKALPSGVQYKAAKPSPERRRTAIERRMEREIAAILARDYEAVAARVGAA
jgi:HK97 family phage portal protein